MVKKERSWNLAPHLPASPRDAPSPSPRAAAATAARPATGGAGRGGATAAAWAAAVLAEEDRSRSAPPARWVGSSWFMQSKEPPLSGTASPG